MNESYIYLGSVRAAIVATVLTVLARTGIITGITRTAAGTFSVFVNSAVDLDRLKITAFPFLGNPPFPVVPSVFNFQFLPFSGDPAASEETAGFVLSVIDGTGAAVDPPDDTNLFICFEQAPY